MFIRCYSKFNSSWTKIYAREGGETMIVEVMQQIAPAQLPEIAGSIAFVGGLILLAGVLKYLSWKIVN